MPTFFHTLDATALQSQADKQHTVHFSTFSCCLNVVLSLDKGDYPENSHDMWCHNNLASFFVCLFSSSSSSSFFSLSLSLSLSVLFFVLFLFVFVSFVFLTFRVFGFCFRTLAVTAVSDPSFFFQTGLASLTSNVVHFSRRAVTCGARLGLLSLPVRVFFLFLFD